MSRRSFDWKLPPAIEQRLGRDSYGPQRAIHEDDHLLLILHEPPISEGNAREAAVFLRKPDGKWLYHGVDNGQYALGQLLERYEKQFAGLEQLYAKAKTAEQLFQVLDRALPLARAAGNLKEAMQAARELVKLDALLIDARDRTVDLARGMELLVGDSRLALDFRLARNAEEQAQFALAGNRAQQKLNVLAAWTFPLMTLAAVFGMNLRGGFENLPEIWFWLVFAVGIVLGMLAKGWVMRAPAEVPKKRG
ncbi:MAG: hypothetical protein H6R15_2649 [Proteobacteria bacterium]|nr:hypothetical protein [Pseudomonadota bacterium]